MVGNIFQMRTDSWRERHGVHRPSRAGSPYGLEADFLEHTGELSGFYLPDRVATRVGDRFGRTAALEVHLALIA